MHDFPKILRNWKKDNRKDGKSQWWQTTVERFRETFHILPTSENASKGAALGKINVFSTF